MHDTYKTALGSNRRRFKSKLRREGSTQKTTKTGWKRSFACSKESDEKIAIEAKTAACKKSLTFEDRKN